MIAALYVQPDGVYAEVPDVELWDERRDARNYAGPYPVVAHPPCQRWGRMAPVNQARYGLPIGDDGGCFAAALAVVRRFGGVLEHPAESKAWQAYRLPWPPSQGWQRDLDGGWCCEVHQGNYGHRARKRSWLYAVGAELPELRWGKGSSPTAWIATCQGYPRARLAALGIGQLGKKEANATPPEFRDVLLAIARSVLSANRA